MGRSTLYGCKTNLPAEKQNTFNNETLLVNKSSRETMGNPTQTQAVSDVAPSTSAQQITGFVDDATTQPASLPFIVSPSVSVIADSMESRVHTLLDVLARPVPVASGIWADTESNNAVLENLSFPQALFDSSPNIVEKLNYFAFFRADVCIRVMVNANTFQLGKLIGYFTPFVEYTGDRLVSTDFPSSYTTYPYVINDASVGNSTDLLIPYVAPYSSYQLPGKIGNIGNFYLRVLNQLAAGSCNYTVYAWFTNISVDLPTGKENQLTAISSTLKRVKDVYKALGQKALTTLNRRMDKFEAQVAGEGEKKSQGVVAATFHTIDKIGTALATVPLLAPIAGPVSWAAKAIAGVAEFFGWAKPLDLSHNQKFFNVPGYAYTQGSGTDSGVLLGTTQDNLIESRGDLFGNKVDEMEISWIVAHKCLVDRFNLSTGDAPGTLRYEFPVTPGWCRFVGAEYQPTVTAFVASMFKYWRGGLKYKIQAAKTAYHSGRLRIIYLPTSPNSTVDAPDQAYNWIFDLRNSSEIEFEIPYNNIIEWAQCGLTDTTNSTFSLGTVRIEVLNELRAPDSVSPVIQFNVWVSGSADLQFAVPEITRYVPSLTSTEMVFEAQVLGSSQDAGFNDMSEKPRMFEMAVASKLDPCKYSIGEMVRNLRVLTRPLGIVSRTTLIASEAPTDTALPNYYFGRAFVPGNDVNAYYISPVDYISWIYKFFRGGMRWKVFFDGRITAGGVQQGVLAMGAPETFYSTITEALFERFFAAAGAFTHRVFNNFNPVFEVTAPFYSQVPIRPVQDPDEVLLPILDNTCVYHRFQRYSTNTDEKLDYYKAGADDFTFGWLVGPPYLVPRTLNTTIPFGSVTLTTYDSGTNNFVITWGNVNLDIRPGTYRILASVPPGTDVPFVADVAAVPTAFPIPLIEFEFLYATDNQAVMNTTFIPPGMPEPVYNATETLVAVQLLGSVAVELKTI